MTVAEAIWKVSSNASHINHIVIAIHGYNQFTFNVSVVLILGALGSLTSKRKSNKLPLLKAEAIFNKIQSLDIVNEPGNKKVLFDFLILFQSYQRLICLPAAKDTCLTEIIVFEPAQLERLKESLKKATQNLNKTIRDQQDLNENPMVSQFANFFLFATNIRKSYIFFNSFHRLSIRLKWRWTAWTAFFREPMPDSDPVATVYQPNTVKHNVYVKRIF